MASSSHTSIPQLGNIYLSDEANKTSWSRVAKKSFNPKKKMAQTSFMKHNFDPKNLSIEEILYQRYILVKKNWVKKF